MIRGVVLCEQFPTSRRPDRGAFVSKFAGDVASRYGPVVVGVAVALHDRGSYPPLQRLPGVTTKAAPFLSYGRPGGSIGRPSWRGKRSVISARAALSRVVRRLDTPDYYYGHFLGIGGVVATSIAASRGVPSIVALGESSPAFLFRNGLRDAREELRALESATLVVSTNENILAAIEMAGARVSHSIVEPNGVDLELFSPPTRLGVDLPIRLLFVGNVVPRKGLSVVLDSLQSAPKEEIVLTIVGHGDIDRLPECATCLGPQPPQVVSELMRQSHALVSASFSEGSPNVVGEAIASGLACILSDIEPHRTLGGGDAFYFEPGDSAALAQILGKVMDEPALIEGARRAAVMRRRDLDVRRRHDRILAAASVRPL